MATSQQFLLCDNSTAANFKNWAQAISNFIRTCGWTNSTDTGQLNGAGPGPGGWASVTTVPGANAFYYEVFQPGDALTNYYLKVEYGNARDSANSPTVRISAGTSTNGAGTLTGHVTNTMVTCIGSFTAPSTTNTYECDMSGDAGRLSFLLWRNAPNNAPSVFAVQRSLNASGSPTGTYVTLWAAGQNADGNDKGSSVQQSLYFSVGAAICFYNELLGGNATSGWPILIQGNTSTIGTLSFNGSIPVWFLQPCVGIWDYPCTVLGICNAGDLTEGVPFTVTNQYGQTKTYVPTRAGNLTSPSPANLPGYGSCRITLCVEYD